MEHFSWFTLAGLGPYGHVIGAMLVVAFVALASYRLKRRIVASESVLPEGRFTLSNVFEILTIDFLLDLFTGIFETRERAERYFPLLATSFVFILSINLMGLVPGFMSPSANFNTTVACSIVIFVMYNYYGFQEHGLGYLKQFMGPVLWLAPLMIVIEVVSHIVRVASLSLRLFWNMTGDHLVISIFTNLTHLVVPALFLALGIFVSFLQAFVFTILSTIYIALAVSHEH